MKIKKPEITAGYVRIPVKTRSQDDKIVTITVSATKGIKALYSSNRKLILTYLFNKTKGWTMTKAKAWIKSRKSSKSVEKAITNMDKNQFKITLPITKTRVKLIKDKNGNKKEERYITGVASSTDIDLVNDRMSPEAIKTMRDSIKRHVINLNAEHNESWVFELGEVTKLESTEKNDLVFESRLNEMSASKDLWYALTELKKKLGVSIGGHVNDYELESLGEKEQIRVFKDVELNHIAIVSEPANPITWVQAIAKSLGDTKKNNTAPDAKTVNKKELLKLLSSAGKKDKMEDVLNLIYEKKSMKKKKTSLKADKKLATPDNEGKKLDKKKKVSKKSDKKTKKTEKPLKTGVVKAKAKTEKTKEKEVKKSAKAKKTKKKIEKKIVKKVKKVKKVNADNKLATSIEKLTKSIGDKFEEISKKLEKAEERLESLESAPASRKGVGVRKGIGEDNDGGNAETAENLKDSLEKALKATEKEYANDTDKVFSEKQKIRQHYKDNYGIT